jgi:signal transduction histidine kinase
LLDKEKQLQAAEIEKQHLLRNLIIILVAVLIAAGGLLFNRFRLKRKIEQQNALLTERKRISRELHDDLGAQLSTAKMFLQSVKGKSQSDYTSIDNSLSLIESSIHDLRTIMDDLQTSTLRDRGYIAATEELVNRVNQLQQINFSLTHHGVEKRLDEKTEHHLFRITQELINNTIKYAQAKNVNLDLLKRDNKIVLMYEDDGVGFDLQNNKRGYGLDNIVSRIQTISGTVEFDTSVNNGFRCVIEV